MDTSLPFWEDSRRLSLGSLVCLLLFPSTRHCCLSSERAINPFTAYGWAGPHSLPSPSDSSSRKFADLLLYQPLPSLLSLPLLSLDLLLLPWLCYFLQSLIHLLLGTYLIDLSDVLVRCTEVLFFFASYGCQISCKWERRKKKNITMMLTKTSFLKLES